MAAAREPPGGTGAAAGGAAARLSFLLEPKLEAAMRDALLELCDEALAHCELLCERDLSPIGGGGGASADVSTSYPLFSQAMRAGGGGGGEGGATADAAAALEWAEPGWYAGSAAVDSLARHAVGVCRRQFAQSTERKVHSLFLLGVLEQVPARLAAAVDAFCHPEATGALDLGSVRAELAAKREFLLAEHAEARSLVDKFQSVRARLGAPVGAAGVQPPWAP